MSGFEEWKKWPSWEIDAELLLMMVGAAVAFGLGVTLVVGGGALVLLSVLLVASP